MDRVWLAFLMTALAGLCTGIGSAIAFFTGKANHRFLSVITGFSAGIMLYVAFTEILGESVNGLVATCGDRTGHQVATAAFFGGILLIFLIDLLVPEADNPHEVRDELAVSELSDVSLRTRPKLLRMGLFTALAIGIHNFPEGLATFMAALNDPSLGIGITVAIAFHNIPEGISVSVPVFFATGNRRQAFALSFASGLAEPIGAGIGYFFLQRWMTPAVIAVVLGIVAGIMVFISLDELLPTSRAYGRGHDSVFGLIAGMLVMAVSLLLMR